LHGRIKMIKRCDLLLSSFAGSVAIFSLAAITAAQGPIRVELRQVLVLTVVFDKKLCAMRDKNTTARVSATALLTMLIFRTASQSAPYLPRISICPQLAKNNGYLARDNQEKTPRRF
jgi:hypothetical protein